MSVVKKLHNYKHIILMLVKSFSVKFSCLFSKLLYKFKANYVAKERFAVSFYEIAPPNNLVPNAVCFRLICW